MIKAGEEYKQFEVPFQFVCNEGVIVLMADSADLAVGLFSKKYGSRYPEAKLVVNGVAAVSAHRSTSRDRGTPHNFDAELIELSDV